MEARHREYALLDWLCAWEATESGVIPDLADMFDGDVPSDEMDSWFETLQDLDGRGLIRAYPTFGVFGSGVQVTAHGRAETEARHRRRDDPLQRVLACREALLRWAYGVQKATSVADFLASPRAIYEGDAFTRADTDAAVTYLAGEGLLHAGSTTLRGMPEVLLTNYGRRHLETSAQTARVSNVVNFYGDNHGALNVGNRDVTNGPVTGRTDAGVQDDAASEECQPSCDTFPAQLAIGRWSVLLDGRLAQFARDQGRLHPSAAPADDRPTEVRFAWRFACSVLPAALRAKAISDALLDLLNGAALMTAAARHAEVTGLRWTRYGDYGRSSLGAILDVPQGTAEPVAWARFIPTSQELYGSPGREAGCADLVIAVQHRRGAIPLGEWATTFTTWLRSTGPVADFLHRLKVNVAASPSPRAAIALATTTDLGDLVDLTSASRIPGTSLLPWFHAATAADNSGVSMEDLSHAWLTTMCEDALRLDDYEVTGA
jgi:hypothetical protein